MFQKIAVVAAMEAEIAFLRKAMIPPSSAKDRHVTGSIGSKTVVLLRTGVGPVKANRRLAELGEPYPQCVLSIGCAGGLSPDVRPGDIIISRLIIDDSDGERRYQPAGALLAAASGCCEKLKLPYRSGTTVSADKVIGSGEEKRALGVKHGALCVDMETAQVAAWAQGLGIPMLSIRTISDGLADRIPLEIGLLMNPDGGLATAKVFVLLVRRPVLALEAVRLKRKFSRSLDVLARIVITLIKCL